MNRLRILLFIALALVLLPARASEASDSAAVEVLRPVTAAYTMEIGGSQLADTYLTPLRYTGWHGAIGYERMQAMKFDPEQWVMQLRTRLGLDRTESEARNSTMWALDLDVAWGMMRRFTPMNRLTVGVGGMASLNLGALYLARNGNNPVSAKAAITLDATAYAAYNMKIGRLPVTLRYQPRLPVIGAFFSPDYGELYYEIYLGNHSGLAHCAWWGTYFRLDNTLTADLHFGGTSVRIGYEGDFFSSKVNDIVTRSYRNSLIIGLSGEWVSLNRKHGLSANARIISALF